MANKSIFRQESLDQVTSPDELDKYIRTAPIQIWLLIVTIVAFLAGALVWASVGYVSVTGDAAVTVKDGQYTFVMDETQYAKVTGETYLTLEGSDYSISEITGSTEDNLTIMYTAVGEASGVKDGTYKGTIVFEKMHPLKFIMN